MRGKEGGENKKYMLGFSVCVHEQVHTHIHGCIIGCLHVHHICAVPVKARGALDSLEQELQMVGAATWEPDLCPLQEEHSYEFVRHY